MAPVVGRIRRQATFRALSRPDGRSTQGPVSVAFSRTCEVPGLAVAGYAIGRRHGGAVPRNRLRRRLREAVRRAAPGLESGAYLVRAAPEATALAFEELCQVVATASRSAAERAAARGGALR